MPVVFDDFSRPDNPTTLGTAPTGQLWTQHTGAWGIDSDNAIRVVTALGVDAYATTESGLSDATIRLSILNPAVFQGRLGMVARWVDDSHHVTLFYDNNFPALRLVVQSGSSGQSVLAFVTLSVGDEIRLDCCGNNYRAFVEDVLVLDFDNTFFSGPFGTRHGLYAQDTLFIGGENARFDDFSVEANAACGSPSSSPSPSASPSSSPSASPAVPCTPPLGRAISCVNARGRLFVTLASDDFHSQIAYAWHEGAQRMPISSVTNWKRSMRALTLQELDVAFETDNPDPLNPMIVSVHRNLRKNYVRDARVNAGSDRIDSLTAQFDSDNIGDMVCVFGANIGGDGIHYILGRVAETSSPSSSPSPSASPSASPSVTESASPSHSPSASPSSSRSGSPSPSHSPSSSPSASPSRSGSASPSTSISASPSASPSSSQSASPSAS